MVFDPVKFSKTLQDCCIFPTSKIFRTARDLGFKVYGTGSKIGNRYAYRKGKHPTSPMIVCHADTVVKRGNGPHDFVYDSKTGRVQSIALDDRLGIACMFQGIQSKSFLRDCAMLICDDEETGDSSAKVFGVKCTPNFMVELDRRGTDVVCYEYDSPILRSLLRSAGFTVGSGSFSDICYLGALGVVGFNVGIGYHREHSTECYASLNDTFAQLARLQVFMDKYADIRLDYDPYFCDDFYYAPPKRSKTKYVGKLPAIDDTDPFFASDGYWDSKDWNRRIDF